MSGEFAAIERIRRLLPAPAPGSREVWIGDDAAVVRTTRSPWTLLAADAVVVGVHTDLRLATIEDLGWKALAGNVSDIAAMGGRPAHALVTVAGPAETDLDGLYRGLAAAARAYDCPIVGGDLVSATVLVVSVAITGTVDGDPVRRDGARPGDAIWVSGPLGRSAAGLRLLRDGGPDHPGAGTDLDDEQGTVLRQAYARPRARPAEGLAARRAGAVAMIDVSDGLAADLWHLADRSAVGFRLDTVPVASGATLEEALGGGEDYELVFCTAGDAPVAEAFAGLRAPVRIGTCTADAGVGTLRGEDLPPSGWRHPW